MWPQQECNKLAKFYKECRKWNDLLPGHRMRSPLALPIVTIVVAERRARAKIPISNHSCLKLLKINKTEKASSLKARA